MSEMTPRQIVRELDRYIIGQDEAKRAVAIALRNRYRRSKLDKALQEEITPKNIMMIGPTGVGKTEIARRLAKLVNAPFIKVEATKFTEVGYVGRDVESMIRELVEAAIRLVKKERFDEVGEKAGQQAENMLVNMLLPIMRKSKGETGEDENDPAIKARRREEVAQELRAGRLDKVIVELEVEDAPKNVELVPGSGQEINIGNIFEGMMPKRKKKRKMSVAEARVILEQQEASKMIDMDEVHTEALRRAEQNGIIFIDEMDKIAGKNTSRSGPDVSREGVQRDILPIVEGSTVSTKYGPVKTDYILFIAAGAFHVAKVSDLIPELQGRFPIEVNLKPLSEQDMLQILTAPENAVTKQYASLLKVDNVNLSFTEDALAIVAKFAVIQNETVENIGARRLHTVMENLLENISFDAGDIDVPVDIQIDADYVNEHLGKQIKEKDLHKFIL